MIRFIIRRVIQSIPTLLGITLLSYAIIVAAPGDPVSALTFGPRTTPAQKAALSERLGVNDPIYQQYFRWLVGDTWRKFPVLDRQGNPVMGEDGEPKMESGTNRGILRGDFGNSFVSRRPALDVVVEKIPATFELGFLALIVGTIIGVPVGILAAVWRGTWFDNATRIIAVFFSAVPIFWLGLMLLLIFGSQLKWLPMGGRFPQDYVLTGEVTPYQRMEHLMLPVFVLSTQWIALLSRFMRAATLDVLNQDYVRTAKAKGLSDLTVWFQHASRNALIPIATLLGPAIPGVLSGALITETIFSWPGIGRTTFTAVLNLDYPIIMCGVILVSIATILGYIISDMLYALVDPRIRLT